MDKTATPVSSAFMRGDTEDVQYPEKSVYRTPGPTVRLRGVEANTNEDKGKPFTYEGAQAVEYGSFVVDPFRTYGGDE